MTLSDWLSLAGLVATVVGLYFAIGQIREAKRSADRARDAVEAAERRMALNHLLVVLPQVRILERDLDRAIEDGDRLAAMRALGTYSHVASEVSGLLREQGIVGHETIERLRQSAIAAGEAKRRLLDSANLLPKSATREFRAGLSEIATSLNALLGQYRLQARENPSENTHGASDTSPP